MVVVFFIAAKTNLLLVREPERETNCKLLWCKLDCAGRKSIHIGAYYRPYFGDEESLMEMEKSLITFNSNHEIILAGDFNFPAWD